MMCVQNFFRNLNVKEFCKSVSFAEVMINSPVYCFLRHSVHPIIWYREGSRNSSTTCNLRETRPFRKLHMQRFANSVIILIKEARNLLYCSLKC